MLNLITENTKQITKDMREQWLDPQNIPPWRRPASNPQSLLSTLQETVPSSRGSTFIMPPTTEHSPFKTGYDAINAALLLRRPLLVKGPPGVGKSSLPYFLAHKLQLGTPLVWPINSRSTLQDGLYFYDAVGHLSSIKADVTATVIQDFIHLQALGEALLPWKVPRVLLIDELDKASYDLPNDLLHVLEEGHFDIPEYRRTNSTYTEDDEIKQHLTHLKGRVQMHHPPILVITSNGERDFSEAFRRRCIVVEFRRHDEKEMKRVIQAHFQDTTIDFDDQTIKTILQSELPTDAMLNAFFIAHCEAMNNDVDFADTLINWLER